MPGSPMTIPPHGSTKRILLCYAVAHASGTDVANRRMRAEGRTTWNAEDFAAASAEFDRLMAEVGGS